MKSKEVDPRIKALTGEVAEGKTARHIEDMINTALGFGRDRATIADLERALTIERTRATITEEKNDGLSIELADARARAAAHLRRVRGETAQDSGGGTDMPRASDAATIADGSGADSVVSGADIDICIENTVRLGNAQRWYREQQEVKQ